MNASPAQTSPPVRAPADDMPAGLESHRLRRRVAQVGLLVVVVAAVVALVPGLAEVRDGLARASPGWLMLAAVLEILSCLAYVVAFRDAFCSRMTWWMSYRIGMSALGAASLLPVGGIGGLAVGAWALRRGGLALEELGEDRSCSGSRGVSVAGGVPAVNLAELGR